MAKKIKSKLTNLFSLKKGDVILYNTPYGKTSDIVEKVDDKKIYFVSKFTIPKQLNSEKYEILEINGQVIFRDGGSIYSDSEFEVYGRAFPVFRVSDSHSDQMIDIMNAGRESKFAKTYGYDIADEFGDIEYSAKNDADLIQYVSAMADENISTVAEAKKYLHSINFSVQEVNYEHLPVGRKGYEDGGSLQQKMNIALNTQTGNVYVGGLKPKNVLYKDKKGFFLIDGYDKFMNKKYPIKRYFTDKSEIEVLEKYANEKFDNGGSVQEERFVDFYQTQGGLKFKTEEEAKGFIKTTKPFVRKQLREGKLALVFNGKEKGGYMGESEKIYKMAEAMTNSEHQKKLGELNEKQKKRYESLVRLGDSPKLAIATILLQKENKWDDDTIRAYTMANGGSVDSLEKELKRLQRELNSPRLGTYIEGDNSEEAKALRQEREVKLARFNEVLQLMREKEDSPILLQKENKWDDDTIRAYTMANGGSVDSLEKELKRLQRELNSPRLGTYIEGDNSDEAKALKQEREVKLARFNEVLQLMREKEDSPSDNNTFVNVLLSYGFDEARSSHGVRFFRNANGYSAFVDMKGKNVEVFKSGSANNYNGFSVQSLVKFLDENGFKKKFEDGGTVVYAKGDTVKENQLFKAVSEDGKIKIYEKGLPLYLANINDVEAHPEWFNDKYLYSVSASELDEAFKELEEESRSDAMEYQKEFVGVFKNGGGINSAQYEVNYFESKLKPLFKEKNKWHFLDETVNGKNVKLKFFVGQKEVDVQVFTINGVSASMPKNYVSATQTLNMILENFKTKFGHGGEIDVAPDDSDYQYMKWLKEKKGKRKKIMFGWF